MQPRHDLWGNLFSKQIKKSCSDCFCEGTNVVNNGLGSVWDILYCTASAWTIWTRGENCTISEMVMLHKHRWVIKCHFQSRINEKMTNCTEVFEFDFWQSLVRLPHLRNWEFEKLASSQLITTLTFRQTWGHRLCQRCPCTVGSSEQFYCKGDMLEMNQR